MLGYPLINHIMAILGPKYTDNINYTRHGVVGYPSDPSEIGAKYHICIHFPKYPASYDYVRQFSGAANPEILERLYKEMNGAKIFNFVFPIYGYRPDTTGFTKLEFFNVPYMAHIHSYYEYPDFAPKGGYLLSKLSTDLENSAKNLFDVLMEDGSIYGGFFSVNSEIIDTFTSLESWLTARVERSISVFEEFEGSNILQM